MVFLGCIFSVESVIFHFLVKKPGNQNEKEKNIELKKKLGIVEDQNNASSEMINDYKNIYDKKYLRNWALILSCLICFAAINSTYRKPMISINK